MSRLLPICDHHDGFGLNESLIVITDEADASGAAHNYVVTYDTPNSTVPAEIVAEVQFQKGPRNEPGSIPGMTEAALIAILIDRLRGFQAGPYACRENALTLTKMEEALQWSQARARERARRGVLGKNAK